MVSINSILTGKVQNYLQHGPQKLENNINERQLMVIFFVQKKIRPGGILGPFGRR